MVRQGEQKSSSGGSEGAPCHLTPKLTCRRLVLLRFGKDLIALAVNSAELTALSILLAE